MRILLIHFAQVGKNGIKRLFISVELGIASYVGYLEPFFIANT